MKTFIKILAYTGVFAFGFITMLIISGQFSVGKSSDDNIAPALPPKAETVTTPAGKHPDIRKAGETDEELKDSLIESMFAVM